MFSDTVSTINVQSYDVVIIGVGAGGRVDQAIPAFVSDLSLEGRVLILQFDPGHGFPQTLTETGQKYVTRLCNRYHGNPQKILYQGFGMAFPVSSDYGDTFSQKFTKELIHNALAQLFARDKLSIFICSVDISGCAGNILLGFAKFGYPKPTLVLNAYSNQTLVYSARHVSDVFTNDLALLSITSEIGEGPEHGGGVVIKGPPDIYDAERSECIHDLRGTGTSTYECAINVLTGEMIRKIGEMAMKRSIPKDLKQHQYLIKLPKPRPSKRREPPSEAAYDVITKKRRVQTHE